MKTISRRHFLAGTAVGACALGGWPLYRALNSSGKKDNLVLFLADDLSTSAFPTLERLAGFQTYEKKLPGEWVNFQNNFVTTSICPTSRASIYLGQMAHTHGVWTFNDTLNKEQFSHSLQSQLRAAGYHVGFIGKWGIGNKIYKKQYDYWDGFLGQGSYFPKKGAQHLTDQQTDSAINYIRTAPQPFCLIIAYKAPHGKFHPQPAYRELLRNTAIPKPENETPKDVANLPNALMQSSGRKLYELHQEENFIEITKKYLRLCAGFSDSIVKIGAAIKQRGCYDDTALVVTSDNGMLRGEHGLVGKWCMYEGSIRTPLAIKLPASLKKIATPVDQLVLNIDLAPSLLEMAGVEPPARMEGKSFLPLLKGVPAAWRESFFYEHEYTHGNIIPPCFGIRHRDWKYVQYFTKKVMEEQFFDLKNDPLEKYNLMASLSSERVSDLRKQVQDWREKTGRSLK